MGSVQFQTVPCSSLYFFSRSIGPSILVSANYRVLICCTCHFQIGSLFLFILASSVCKSLQCLISTLTQSGRSSHLFRLTCSVVLWGRRNTANKYHWHVWGGALSVWATLGLPHLKMCVLSWSTLLRLQVALQGNCLKRAPGCVHFPGLSHSGSGSQVLHKGTDSVGTSQVRAAQVTGCLTSALSQLGGAS